MIFQHKTHENVSSWLSIEFIQDRFIYTISESCKEFNEKDITLDDIKKCDMEKDVHMNGRFPLHIPAYNLNHTICVLTPVNAINSYIIDRSCYGLFNILVDNVHYIKKRFPGDSIFRETVNYLNSKNKIDHEDVRLKELVNVCETCRKYVIYVFNAYHSKRDPQEVEKRIHCCGDNLIAFMSRAIYASINYINNRIKSYGLMYSYLSKEKDTTFITDGTAKSLLDRKLMYYPQTVVFTNPKVSTLFYNRAKHMLVYCAEKKNIECPFNHHDKARNYDRNCKLEIPADDEKIDLLAVEYYVSKEYKNHIDANVEIEPQNTWIFSNKVVVTGNITERDFYKFNSGNITNSITNGGLFQHFCERTVKSIKINNLALGNLNG